MQNTIYPLGLAQLGLWYVQEAYPHCAAYNLIFSCKAEVQTALQAQAGQSLRTVLDEMQREFALLRACMPLGASGPEICIAAKSAAPLTTLDLQDLSPAAQTQQLYTWSKAPFVMGTGLLWRVAFARLAPEKFQVVFVVHHALLDFWSLGLLLQHVVARLRNDEPPAIDGGGCLKEAPQAQDLAAAYWQQQLAGAAPAHGLVLDMARPPKRRFQGASLPFALSPNVTAQIKKLAQEHAATPFMVLLATYCLLLYKLDAGDDLLIASPVAGRTDRAQMRRLGQYVNTLPLRIQLRGEHTFADVIAAVKRTVIDGVRHQAYPFHKMVEMASLRPDPSLPPLSQLGFSWDRLPLLEQFSDFFVASDSATHTAITVGDVVLSPAWLPQQEGQMDLQLEMGGEVAGAYTGLLKYDADLWHASSAQSILGYFVKLCESLESAHTKRLTHISLLTPRQCTALGYLGTGPCQQGQLPHSLGAIARAAEQFGTRAALIDDAGTWTYQELYQSVLDVRQHLLRAGIQPGAHIGVYCERNRHLLVALLAVWACDASYVPLDPIVPIGRLQDMAADAALAMVLCDIDVPSVQTANGVPIACMRIDALPALQSAWIADWTHLKNAAAYLIYTSGSTGKPKGVRVSHAALANFLAGMQMHLGCNAQTRVLAITTLIFDIAGLELFLPLLHGGQVFIASREVVLDADALAHAMQQFDINLFQATPSTWRMLVDSGWVGKADLVGLCGGEALPRELANTLPQRMQRLWNVYGPTETTIWSTLTPVLAQQTIHLGVPLLNTQLYVLDEQLQLQAPGAMGELWIGGAGLAIDYWSRPELTQEKFRAVASLPDAGRLYRTGDRVRWSYQHQLEHLGRLDHQVKLRGYRIELDEISSRLMALAHVEQAVTMLQKDAAQQDRIVSYIVLRQEVDELPLAHYLQELTADLPAYMLPSAIVHLQALPQTLNGKLNRSALPAPDWSHKQAHSVGVAPRDHLEIKLLQLFGQVLQQEVQDVHLDFFEAGGHSLLAVQLVALIKQNLERSIPIQTLMQARSVAKLAQHLRQDDEGATASANTSLLIKDGKRASPLWLFHPIGGNVFCYLALGRALKIPQAVFAVPARGLQDLDAIEVTVEKMATTYVAQLREEQPHGPYLLGGWCFGGVIAYEVARQLQALGEVIEQLVMFDTRAPIQANHPADADDATLMAWFARDLAAPYGKSLNLLPAELRLLEPDAMFAHVLDAAKAIEVLPVDADSAVLRQSFEVYLANGIALQLHQPEPLELPIALYRAMDEAEDFGPELGWSSLVRTGLSVIDMQGNHNSIMYSPAIDAVAADLHARLSRATAHGSPQAQHEEPSYA